MVLSNENCCPYPITCLKEYMSQRIKDMARCSGTRKVWLLVPKCKQHFLILIGRFTLPQKQTFFKMEIFVFSKMRCQVAMAQLMMHSLPRQARAMIAQKTMCHSDLVILADPDGCTRPTYKACLEFKFVFKKHNVALMFPTI